MKLINRKKSRGSKKLVRYAHIGYPKCASTALQRGYFGPHRQLLHLGCGAEKNSEFWDDHGYATKQINQLLEVDLRYKTKYAYDVEEAKAAMQPYFDQAEADDEIHAVGISNENLCFNWHGGIDTSEKAERLFDIFGDKTEILIVLRDQKSLIESLYKESVRFGYSGLFQDYLKYIWQYRDRSFFYDFMFENVIRSYSELFGEDHVHVMFFEDLKEDSASFLKDISSNLGFDYYELPLDKEFNQQLSNEELAVKRYMNEKYPHTFEMGVYHPADTHRYVPYLTNNCTEELGFEHYFDYHLRNGLCEIAKKVARETQLPTLDLSWKGEYAETILDAYNESNRELHRLSGDSRYQKYGYTELNGKVD
ncbi:hypothetical protein N9V19_01340 [Opitutales bacterium]|nr:hypothetical protein [Opitutales bacterium]